MNNKLYGNLIFELSRPGRRAYSLPKNRFAHHELPAGLRREQDAELPECDEMTVVRHYTNHSENNFGVLNGFYPLGSCTMKYNPRVNDAVAALSGFTRVHPLQGFENAEGCVEVLDGLSDKLCEMGYRATADLTGEKIGKKIRLAQMEKIPYMLVVGDRDMEAGTVSVRTRRGEDLGAMPLDEFAAVLREVVDEKQKI